MKTSRREWLLLHGRELGGIGGLILLCLVLWILTPYFLTVSNLVNVAQQTAINAIIAVGMTYVIITAGIDLSVGSILAFSGVILARALNADVPLPVALLAAIGAGTALGVVNGLLITYGRLPPFISTLGMMSVARGLALIVSDGRPISGFSESLRFLANGDLIGVPMPVVITGVVMIAGQFCLKRTWFGRYVYAIGGNEEAARLSGINITFVKVAVYGLAGALSALAAIVLTARLNSAQPTAGSMYELDAIAATVIGGSSLMGGEGSVVGTLIGALIMGVLRNGLNLLDVSSFIQQTVIGSAIIAAVLIDMAIKRHRV